MELHLVARALCLFELIAIPNDNTVLARKNHRSGIEVWIRPGPPIGIHWSMAWQEGI